MDSQTERLLVDVLLSLQSRLEGKEWQPINNGRQQSSYREFTIILPAKGIYTLNNPFNFCRCLEATNKFKVAWSSNSMDTEFNAGLQAKFDSILPYVQIFNDSESENIISIGVGVGDFDDSRLTVSGIVKTEPAQYTTFSTTRLTFPEDGTLTIPPAAKVILQNSGSTVIHIGAVDGLELQASGTFEYSLASPLEIYGTAGQSVVVGSF